MSYDRLGGKRARRRQGAPWLLLVLLGAACYGAWTSWPRDASSRRALLDAGLDEPQEPVEAVHVQQQEPAVQQESEAGEAEAEEADDHLVVGHEWQQRKVSSLDQEQLDGLQRGPHDAQVVAGAPIFNEGLHRMYNDLPALEPVGAATYAGGMQLTQALYDYAVNQPMAEVISWDNPRAAVFRSFLSPDEVSHFINISEAKLVRSEVLSATDGAQAVDTSRTSYGTWPEKDDVVNAVTNRIHRLVGVPERFGEDIYVLNYKQGQKYEAHNDHCMDGRNGQKVADEACRAFLTRSGGPACGADAGGPSCGDRIATFILTLRGAPVGGATVFPESDITKKAVGEDHPNDHQWYCKHEGVLGVKGNPGDALLFWDYAPGDGGPGSGSYEDGTAQPSANPVYAALHSGCPVLEGDKWIATRWIRGAGFDYRGEDLEN